MLGKFTLNWSGGIKIWKTADKNGAAVKGAEVTPGQVSNYWVEGLGPSRSMAAEQIALIWTDVAANTVPKLMDKVNFTVYEVTGAMNVPGFSMHEYQVRTPINSNFVAVFASATSGTIGDVSFVAENGRPLITNTNILWAGGPIIGTYRVSPDISVDNFFVDREVNVVQVSIATAIADNKIVIQPDPVQHATESTVILSVDPRLIPDTIVANLLVKRLEGPAVGGNMRGVRFIEFGMIQN